jgi:hypothetical protein
MRNALLRFCLFILALSVQEVRATHYMGADLVYICNPTGSNPCCYRLLHSVYYDCLGAATIPLPGPPTIHYYDIVGNNTNCNLPVALNAPELISYIEITPVCPNYSTGCTNPSATLNGILQSVHFQDWDMCNLNCTEYTFSWTSCCRNYAITSISTGASIYSYLKINPSAAYCNSSPVFINTPVPYICLNQSTTFIQGAFDAEGDSLVYALDACFMTNATDTVLYNPGYSYTSPFGANGSISIDPTTGEITLSCTTMEVVVFCLKVEEYRNNQLLSTIRRDVQVNVVNCGGTNNQPLISGFNNTSNYQLLMDCSNYTSSITFDVSDPDPNDTIFMVTWDSMIPGGVLSSVINGNTAQATIDLTNVVPGTYTFRIQAYDNFCPIYGRTEEIYTLYFQDSTATLISGLVTDSQNNPIPNCRVYLIKFDPVAQAIWQSDMTYTNASGMYNFTSCGDTVFVKAAPDSLNYPNEIPCYHASEIVFQNANPVALNASSVTADIQTQSGANTGGFGLIAGYLSQGANRMAGFSQNRTANTPLEGVRLVLMNQSLQAVGYTTTDVNGYFAFPDLDMGTYSIWVDAFRIENNLAPVVTLTAIKPILDDLELYLNRKWLELIDATGITPDFLSKAKIYPNPAGSRIQLSGFPNTIKTIRFISMDGKTAWSTEPIKSGQKNEYAIDIPGTVAEGIYILELETTEGLVSGRKIIIKR